MSDSKEKGNKLSDEQTKGECIMERHNSLDERILIYDEENQYNDYDMKKGYMEMAQINLEISEISCTYDLEECEEYESWLSESDIFNVVDNGKEGRHILCRP